MSDDYARPRSMADRVIEQATAAPGEYRVTPQTFVEHLTFKPGDVLVVKVPDMITREGVEQIRAAWRNVTDVPVVIASGGTSLAVVHEPSTVVDL